MEKVESVNSTFQPERVEALRTRFLRYKTIFLAYWWIVALTTGIGLAVQGWFAFTRPPVYQSQGRILVSGRITVPEGSLYNEEAMNFFGTQIELMNSAEVRNKAATQVQSRRPDLTPVPVSIEIMQVPRTSVFVLTATGSSPEYVKAYLDAVMQSYIEKRASIVSTKSQNTLSAITDELNRMEKELRNQEDDLYKWQKENNLVFQQTESNATAQRLARLNEELANLQIEYNMLDQLTIEQNLDRMNLPGGTEPAGGEQNVATIGSVANINMSGAPQEYMAARQKLILLEARLEQVLATRRPDHPVVKDVQEEIKQQKRLMGVLRDQTVEQFQSKKESLAIRIRNLQNEVTKYERLALDLSGKLGYHDRLQAKVARQKALYDKLVASVQSVDVNSNIQQDFVEVMEYASPPTFRIVDVARELTTGGMLGALVGAGILFGLGLLDDRIMSLAELQSVFEEEVVGIIPKMPEGQSLLTSEGVEQSALAEAFRNIRSWLLLSPWEGGRPKTIVLTSAIPEEGKSTVSANLAITLAATGAEVLLVDADLRRGKMHKLFQVNLEPGLGDALSGEVPFDQIIYSVDIEHLHVVPRGPYPEQSTETFFDKTLTYFYNQVVPKFDYVVIDTGPTLAVDDTSALASKADIVLMVVRSSFTGTRLVRKALSLLNARHANVEGLIFNCVEQSSADYPYYHYDFDAEGKRTKK